MIRKTITSVAVLIAVWGILSPGYGQADLVSSVAPPSVVFEVLALNKDLPTIRKPKYRSPNALVKSIDEKYIYICEQTAKRIAIYDVAAKEVIDYIHFPNEVTGCAVSNDDQTIYATCGSEIWPNGLMCEASVASREVTRRIPVGHYPRSPVLTPDGSKLYVCNMFGDDISIIHLASGDVDTVDVVREPYSAAITPDGKMLVIGNSLPDDRSTDTNDVSCKITLFDVATDKVIKDIRLTRGSHSVYGLTLSADGNYAFATHLIGKFNMIVHTVAAGWLHTNNIAVIDLVKQEFVNDVCLDLATIGMGNPWGIRCSEDGKFMAIAHAGSNELSIIKYKAFLDTVLARSGRGVDMQKDFTSMLKSRQRVKINTKGPREVVIIGNEDVYTAGYFDDANARLEKCPVVFGDDIFLDPAIKIGEPVAWTGERNGESNYYDAALCYQKWQSCHSCHPFSRPDALNWILGGGAVVTPKNAKSMLYSWWTSPTTWTGRRGHAKESIRAGIKAELFQSPSDVVAVPLDTFFMYLKPLPSPHLVKGKLSESAKRGKMIYYNKKKVDCITCHPPPLFTDNQGQATTLPDPFDQNASWITPHLIESWRTGPYGHLGQQWGMREILEAKGHSANYNNLDMQEKEDLVEYIMSL